MVCIDYSSINIAKPFHIGHLMSTAIGNALYRIYNYRGYTAIGINHLGDWGTQFGKLCYAFEAWGSKEDVDARGIDALLAHQPDTYERILSPAGSMPEPGGNQPASPFTSSDSGE